MKQKKPFISIVVPVYNSQTKIVSCIESILNQSYTDFELILVNDGSTDKSGMLCNEYTLKDSRVKIFHKMNEGVSKARNFGIQNAKGEWVTFIDSDDRIEKNYLLNMIGVDQLKDDDIVLTGVKYIDFHEQKIIRQINFPKQCIELDEICRKMELLDKLFVFRFGLTFCHLYNMTIINKFKLHFHESLCLHEDHLFFFEYLGYVNRIFLRPHQEYCYLIDHSAISLSRGTKKSVEELLLAYDMMNNSLNTFLKKWNCEESRKKMKLINSFMIVMMLKIEKKALSELTTYEDRKKIINLYQKIDIIKFYRPKKIKGVLQFIFFAFVPRTIINLISGLMVKHE